MQLEFEFIIGLLTSKNVLLNTHYEIFSFLPGNPKMAPVLGQNTPKEVITIKF